MTSPCSCQPGEPYLDGTLPQFYTSEVLVLRLWLAKGERPLYWGLHLFGEHVLSVLGAASEEEEKDDSTAS
jgi:hypothetical protein